MTSPSPSSPPPRRDDGLPQLLDAPERVLSTLNKDGSRRWLRPRLSRGRFLSARRAFAWVLILLFTILPHVDLAGRPAVLLDIARREFTILGFTFLPTDTLLLAVFLLSVFVAVFLLTALFGRVWCGWACPQTVYLEFLYRPLERFFDGAPGRRPRCPGPLGLRVALKVATFVLASLFIAHTFLAYFVGADTLRVWVTRSPLEHPVSFVVMAAVTGLMLFDFGFFREQTCIVACPYGRFQSVLLDRHSLIVGYDRARGEPRGKVRRAPDAVSLPVLPTTTRIGDCVDCGLCVATCPTGIDIRDGLQMECVGCAQCIDACDAVMARLHRPRGLIRYSSQATLDGLKPRLLRPRVIVYPLLLGALLMLLAVLLRISPAADVSLLRTPGIPFTILPDGRVANTMRVKIINRRPDAASFTIEPAPGSILVEFTISDDPGVIAPGRSATVPFVIAAPREGFSHGHLDTIVRISDGRGFTRDLPCRLVGPQGESP